MASIPAPASPGRAPFPDQITRAQAQAEYLDRPIELVRLETPTGHGLHSIYYEHFWLPIVGPSATCLARYVAGNHGEATTLRRVGEAIGLAGDRVTRALKRARHFRLIDLSDPRQLAAVAKVPDLPRPLHRRLPPWRAAQLEPQG